jgi:hypothetical protein
MEGSAFNSANWIKRGNQRRFEMVNAENFAFVGRLDFRPNSSFMLGYSFYSGNTTQNRPKPDLQVNTTLLLNELHLRFIKNPYRFTIMGFYGSLSNSEALTKQNRNLSNNLNVKRTPVGASAVFGYLETGLTLFGEQAIFKKCQKHETIFYGRYDYYDTMNSTEGVVFNNPRWARSSYTLGLVYKLINDVHFKTQYSIRNVGAPAPTSLNGGTTEKTFIAGFAFEF